MLLVLFRTRSIVVFVRGRYLYGERSFVVAAEGFPALLMQYQLRFY
jgi:hypothetical protein